MIERSIFHHEDDDGVDPREEACGRRAPLDLFAQLRPKTRWVALSLSLARAVEHPRIGPKVQLWGGRYYHVFNLRGPEDLDDRIRACLTEAYLLDAED